MHFSSALSFALVGLASAAPTLTKKQSSNCAQYATVETGSYTVYNNLWGQDNADSGSQCFTISSLADNVLAWSTTYVLSSKCLPPNSLCY